jgi:hypothetical protein
MLNRADDLAARDNYHGQVTWCRIMEAVGQLANKTPPGALQSAKYMLIESFTARNPNRTRRVTPGRLPKLDHLV